MPTAFRVWPGYPVYVFLDFININISSDIKNFVQGFPVTQKEEK